MKVLPSHSSEGEYTMSKKAVFGTKTSNCRTITDQISRLDQTGPF